MLDGSSPLGGMLTAALALLQLWSSDLSVAAPVELIYSRVAGKEPKNIADL